MGVFILSNTFTKPSKLLQRYNKLYKPNPNHSITAYISVDRHALLILRSELKNPIIKSLMTWLKGKQEHYHAQSRRFSVRF